MANQTRKNQSYYLRNKERVASSVRAYQLRTKVDVLSHYSSGIPHCATCGENDLRFLGLDHLDGGGKAHKREIGGGGGYVYLWARKHGFPPVFQVLCHNCNVKKGPGVTPSARLLPIKRKALSLYSSDPPRCLECGEDDIRVLTIDHINNDGAEDRKKLGVRSSTGFYRYLLRTARRSDLQVLCQNHNLGKVCLG